MDLQAVPWPFLATKRSTLRDVKMTAQFADHGYSDADYCVRVRRTASRVLYDPAIVVQTSGKLHAQDAAGLQLFLASAGPVYDEWAML